MNTYKFFLKVDNAYDLQDSTLFWKYHSNDEIQSTKIKSREACVALFEIQGNSGSIEYWYENSKNNTEMGTRIINLENNIKIEYDRFNCLNLIVKCSINSQNLSQYTQLYYIGQDKRKLINYTKETLIYIPFWSKKAQFLIEYQDDYEKQQEITFHILLESLSHFWNSLQLEIFRDDLDTCLYQQHKIFKQQNGNIIFYIDNRRERDFDEIIIFQQNQVQKEAERQSNNFGDLIKQINTMNKNLSSTTSFSQSFKKIDNYFSETQNTTKLINKQQSQIMPIKRVCKPESILRKTEDNFYEKNQSNQKIQDLYEKSGRKQQSTLGLNNILEQKRQIDESNETEEEETKNMVQTTVLQANICDPSLYQLDNITLIKQLQEKDNMIKELKTNYQQEINNLKVQIQDLNIKLNEEKEHAQDLSRLNQFKFIQNFRSRRFSPQMKNKTYSQSTANIMKVNPTLSFAKDVISQNNSSFFPNSTQSGFRQQNGKKSYTLKTEASHQYQ